MAVKQSLQLRITGQSVKDNTSEVCIIWESTQTGESWNGYTRTASYFVSINGGSEKEYVVTYTLPQNATQTIVERRIVVPHRDDGTGDVKVRTVMNTGISAGVVELTKSIDLYPIPRATTLDSLTCSSALFDGTFTYKYTPRSSYTYNRCIIYLRTGTSYTAVKTINLGQKSTSTQTATVKLSAEELASIYNKLTTTIVGTLRFSLISYDSASYDNQIGDASYKDIDLRIPNAEASADVTIEPVSDDKTDEPVYIKGRSKLKCTISNAKAANGATIQKYVYILQDVRTEITQNTFTTGYLTVAGSATIRAGIYDSRGSNYFWSKTFNVLDYSTPKLDSLTCDTSYFNGNITYKYTPACSAFYSQCVISLGDTIIKTISYEKQSNVQQTETVTFTEEELSTIYNKLPNVAKGKLRFTYRMFSYSDYTNQVGEDSYKEITLSVPKIDETQPTATMSLTPVSILGDPFDTLYIKGKAKIKATLAEGEGKYGASIASCKITIGGKTEDSPYTSDYLISSGDVSVTGTVTDSRGISRTYTSKITVLDYATPRILPISGEDEVISARCDESGNLTANGTYLRIKAKRDYSKLSVSGEQNNFCKIQYRYKADGGSYNTWTTILEDNASSDEVDTGAILGSLEVTKSYFVQVRAVDSVGEAMSTSNTISTEKVYWHRAGSIGSLGFGKYAEEANTFDIAEDKTAIFRGEVRFPGEKWTQLPLGTNVAESDVDSGRWGGSGVYYRVCAGGKHIYVAFNVSFKTSSSIVRAESETIPSAYSPKYDVYALCPVGFADESRGFATVSVSPSGRVNIYAVHKLPGAVLSTGETVAWIDGYIDFWT